MDTSGLRGSREVWVETHETRRAPEYSAMQLFFLTRLTRLTELSHRIHTEKSKEWQRTLVKKAIFSTFNDCIALSLETEALRAVRAARGES